jgi:hypothetical protein
MLFMILKEERGYAKTRIMSATCITAHCSGCNKLNDIEASNIRPNIGM